MLSEHRIALTLTKSQRGRPLVHAPLSTGWNNATMINEVRRLARCLVRTPC